MAGEMEDVKISMASALCKHTGEGTKPSFRKPSSSTFCKRETIEDSNKKRRPR